MSFQGIGLTFPFVRTDTGTLQLTGGDAKLIQNVADVCRTQLGSVYYMPHQGWARESLLFMPIDEVRNSLVETLLGEAIEEQEPRVLVEGFVFEKLSEVKQNITVFFSSKETNEALSYVFPFYRQTENG